MLYFPYFVPLLLNITKTSFNKNLTFKDQIKQEKVKEVFNEMDDTKSGSIRVEDFIKLMETSVESNNQLNYFYESMLQDLTSPLENILVKLRKLRKIAYFKNDVEAMKDFDW